MSAWIKRFGLHLAAAVGATGIFVAAAAVGATQTRQQVANISSPTAVATRVRPARIPRPNVAPVASPTPARAVRPERSLAGTISQVEPDAITIVGVGGRTWRVVPDPGALIRLNGKAAHLDALQPGNTVVILGQAEAGRGLNFLAHAITAKSK
jgi:hypothetical protein